MTKEELNEKSLEILNKIAELPESDAKRKVQQLMAVSDNFVSMAWEIVSELNSPNNHFSEEKILKTIHDRMELHKQIILPKYEKGTV